MKVNILAVVMMIGVVIDAAAVRAAAAGPVETVHEVAVGGGGTMTVTYSAPEGVALDAPARVLIVFPPGGQTPELERLMRSMFAAEATRRGWVVVTPRPPEGKLFPRAMKELFPALLEEMDKAVRAADGRYHVAGPSNGGMSAFAFAAMYPERTASVMGFPGALPVRTDERAFGQKLKDVPIRMWVGEQDDFTWRRSMEAVETFGKKYGLDVVATSVNGQGHVIQSLSGADIMNELEKVAAKAPEPMSAAQREVLALLDALHAAASKADGNAYFALYAPEAVFIGTDAGERWTKEEFRAYAAPYFSQGKGWTYVPRPGTRHVTLLPDTQGRVGFFEELLDSEKYGTCRGTGVVRMIGGEWKVCQYHLTFPVPNDMAQRVTGEIKAWERGVR